MMPEARAAAAKYYDLNPRVPNDVPFYLELSGPGNDVLELGCGTGRVTVPLVRAGRRVCGLDHSLDMLSICQRKAAGEALEAPVLELVQGDITKLDLGRTFDLIIAPFRVIQNLESDEEITGLFDGIRRHLAPTGSAILNVFNPNLPRDRMAQEWCRDETLSWEVETPNGRVACFGRHDRLDPKRLVLYPDLVYRRYEGTELQEEVVLPLVMRCYYPDEFEALVASAGFRVLDRWGGYGGESYGVGPELVLRFARDA